MYEEFANAQMVTIKIAERTIEHRMAWSQIAQIERLERALSAARGRLQSLKLSAKVY